MECCGEGEGLAAGKRQAPADYALSAREDTQHQGLKESGLATWAVALTGDGRLAGL
jgi:hypothetical protein